MTDKASRAQLASELNLEDLLDFLKERNASFKCEVCGTQSWTNYRNEDLIPGLTTKRYPGSIAEGQSLPMFMLTCKNCANVRIFNKSLILRWKESKEEETNE